MIKSMTGFASLTRDDELATITVTVKAVNHRFLDLQLRLPPSLGAVESRVRGLVQQRVSRAAGVEVSVSLQQRRAPALEVELNEPFLDALSAALERARERGYVDGRDRRADLLRFPQALTIREKADEASARSVAADRRASRRRSPRRSTSSTPCASREGSYLRADLDARRARLGELFERVAAAAEAGHGGLQTRLVERVRELRADALADEAAIAQEIARVRRPIGYHRRGRAVPRPPRALAGADGVAGAVRPQARFPAAGDEPRGQHRGSKAEGPAVSELDRGAQGRAREDAGAGAECRVDAPARRGLLFVVSAPSGTGKTTSSSGSSRLCPDLALSRSYTSRAAGPGETDGVDYNFITRPRSRR